MVNFNLDDMQEGLRDLAREFALMRFDQTLNIGMKILSTLRMP